MLDKFLSYLRENAIDQALLGHALDSLAVFDRAAASRAIGLSPASAIDRDAAAAISAAVGRPVKKVIVVSASAPDAVLAGENGKFCGQKLWQSIETTLWDRLHSCHKLSLWDGFARPRRQPKELGNELWERFDEAIGRDLKGAVSKSLPGTLGYDIVETCRNHLWYGLFYYLGFAVNGNVERVQRLSGLIELMGSAIPLGEKRGEPGTWYVLAA